jgi:hypothetical protein
MGGWGSGRRYGSRSTTSQYLRIDVRSLQRGGYLDWRSPFSWRWSSNGEPAGDITITPHDDRITLSYTTGKSSGNPKDHRYDVTLERLPCNYGGTRPWFRCPVLRCGRRVAILYGGEVFACRRCYGLAYNSQQQSPGDRADARAWAIRERCKPKGRDDWGGLFDPIFRPKGMHARTFNCLRREYGFYCRTSILAFTTRHGISAKGLLGDTW